VESLAGKRVLLWVSPRALDADSARGLSAMRATLARLGCRVEMLTSDEQVSERLRHNAPDLILAHVCNMCRGPLEMLARLGRYGQPVVSKTEARPPVVLLATALDMPAYLEGMRRGAFDCVGLPMQEKEFVRILTRALQHRVGQPA
jgi:CheY-like chemotaxis protein